MRIHLISNLFAPDELAGASLYTDLALYLRDAGHDVRVTTTFSYYPQWKLRTEDRGVKVREESLDGIPVRRVSMFVPEKPSGKGRMLSDASFLWSLWRRGQFPGWTPDIVVTALPMLSECLVQRFQYPLKRVPRFIIVQDFAVEAALELGIVKLPGVQWLLRAIQRWALTSAEVITTISPLMLEKLRKEVGDRRRTEFIPNWIHGSLQSEIERQRASAPPRTDRRLFYSGNLGVKQGLPDFLNQFATSSVSQLGWTLDICGGGAERERIAATAQQISGLELGDVLEETSYIRRLLSTTACLVTQRSGVGANFLPSKLLPALATGTPVLAVCDESSPLAKEVVEGDFGQVIAPGDASGLRTCLERWSNEPSLLERFQANALNRALLYSRNVILPRYEQLFREIVDRR